MVEIASGIILRTRPLTETSLVVHWLGARVGRIATVAKGARRPKSPFFGKLDLFYEAEFSFSRSRRSELHLLREVTLRETHRGLRNDLGSLQQSAYAVALIEQATETETPLETFYDILNGFLCQVARGPVPPWVVFALELKLLDELGMQPDLEGSRLSNPARTLMVGLGSGQWAELVKLPVDAALQAEVRDYLHGFMIYHLGKLARGRDTALAAGKRPA